MDKIEKFLRSLNSKDQKAMLLLLQQLKADSSKVPGIVALVGHKGFYRVRMGRYRIIFFFDPKSKSFVLKQISRRNEKTYKDFR